MLKKLTMAALLGATPVMAEDAAVLLGVSNYENFDNVEGATGITGAADRMERMGFAVRARNNPSRSELLSAFGWLGPKLSDADRAILVMNGTFVHYGDSAWFMAADADRPSVLGPADQGIHLNTILEIMAEVPGGAIVVLGTPANQGRYRGRLDFGIGEIEVPQGVTLITGEPDQVSRFVRSRLTDAGTNVIAAARDDGLAVDGFMPRNLPVLPGTLSFNFDEDRPNPDLQGWEAAQAANTVEAYQKYLTDFPRGAFRSEARTNLLTLQNDPAYQDRISEERLGLSRNQRRQVQRDLTLMGYNTRGIDGLFGQGTRRAIAGWQRDQGYANTGFIAENQLNLLQRQAQNRRAQLEEQDRSFWADTGASGRPNGLRQYLERYPEGLFADRAKEQLAALTSSNSGRNQAAADERALNLSPVILGLVEFQLQALGHNPGALDGRLDDSARGAIRSYQQQQGLEASGYLNRATLARLINR